MGWSNIVQHVVRAVLSVTQRPKNGCQAGGWGGEAELTAADSRQCERDTRAASHTRVDPLLVLPDAAARTRACCCSQVASKGCHQLMGGSTLGRAAVSATSRPRWPAAAGPLRPHRRREVAARVHLYASLAAGCRKGASARQANVRRSV